MENSKVTNLAPLITAVLASNGPMESNMQAQSNTQIINTLPSLSSAPQIVNTLPTRRPGRPPKKRPEILPSIATGLSIVPSDPDNLVEISYCNPIATKKLLTLCKGYGVAELEFIFDKAEFKIIAKDHSDTTSIIATFNGAFMNFYHCSEKIRICVKRAILQKLLDDTDKPHFTITFILTKEDARSKLGIIIKDCQYDKINYFSIGAIYKELGQFDQLYDESAYPLKFTFDSKHFKKEVKKISDSSQFLTIRKTATDSVEFTFDDNDDISHLGKYLTGEKIKLVSTITGNDMLNVSVNINYIKPFSNSAIGDEVQIAVDKVKRLCCTTYIDKRFEGTYLACVKVFSEIVVYDIGKK